MKLIGTSYLNYPQKRNFADLKYGSYTFVEVKDVFRRFTNVAFYFIGKIYAPLQFLFFHSSNRRIEAYHFFNTISFNNKPWIVTFETSIPRLGSSPRFLYRLTAKRLAHKSCKRIIAISECTAAIQRAYLENAFPEIAAEIDRKLMILHPAQPLLLKEYEAKDINDKIVFTLIGADFFRKGGKEVLLVFDKLITEGKPVHLNIISSLNYGDYASHSTKDDFNYANEIINKHPYSISHYCSLPNEQALKVLLNSHVGLLPTYADTYGYSVLEAQAAGCPVITTNVRALTEINDNETGWVINLPLDNNFNALLKTQFERKHVSDIITRELKLVIDSVLIDPTIINRKGRKSWNRIREFHDPMKNARILEQVYDAALQV